MKYSSIPVAFNVVPENFIFDCSVNQRGLFSKSEGGKLRGGLRQLNTPLWTILDQTIFAEFGKNGLFLALRHAPRDHILKEF